MEGRFKVVLVKYLLVIITMVILAACGGGSDGEETPPSPTDKTATLHLSTIGTPAANLAGITMTLILPDGVTPFLNEDGSLTAPVAVVSGVAAPGMVLSPIYLPANSVTKGTLNFALASSIEAGFASGEYATVTLRVAVGAHPVQTDFDLTGFIPIDVGGNEVTDLSAMVTGLVVQ